MLEGGRLEGADESGGSMLEGGRFEEGADAGTPSGSIPGATARPDSGPTSTSSATAGPNSGTTDSTTSSSAGSLSSAGTKAGDRGTAGAVSSAGSSTSGAGGLSSAGFCSSGFGMTGMVGLSSCPSPCTAGTTGARDRGGGEPGGEESTRSIISPGPVTQDEPAAKKNSIPGRKKENHTHRAFGPSVPSSTNRLPSRNRQPSRKGQLKKRLISGNYNREKNLPGSSVVLKSSKICKASANPSSNRLIFWSC